MSNEVDTEQILQAITELSQQLNQTERNLNDKIEKNTKEIAKVDAKLSVLSENLLHTQAEVKQLKNAQ